MSAPKPHYMLFDTDAGGHRQQYIGQLARYWVHHALEGTLDIVVSQEFIDQNPEFIRWVQDHEVDGLNVFVTGQNFRNTDPTNAFGLAARSLELGRFLREQVEYRRPDHCVLMHFDHFQLALALDLHFTFPVFFSGIYFRPYTSTNTRHKAWLKRLVLGSALRNPHFRILHCLDPTEVDLLNARHGKAARIEWLPDGIEGPSAPPFDLHTKYGIPLTRKIILLFGRLTQRKGVLQALEAIATIDPTDRANVALILIGEGQKFERERIEAAMQRVSLLEGSSIVLDERFVPEDDVQPIISNADLLLLPYQDHVGSSGILIRAAAAQKPVIGPNTGLVGSYIREHRLGLPVNTASPAAIASGIQSFLRGFDTHSFDPDSSVAFASTHTSDAFAAAILRDAVCFQTATLKASPR